jgi:hypothetical protein
MSKTSSAQKMNLKLTLNTTPSYVPHHRHYSDSKLQNSKSLIMNSGVAARVSLANVGHGVLP